MIKIEIFLKGIFSIHPMIHLTREHAERSIRGLGSIRWVTPHLDATAKIRTLEDHVARIYLTDDYSTDAAEDFRFRSSRYGGAVMLTGDGFFITRKFRWV